MKKVTVSLIALAFLLIYSCRKDRTLDSNRGTVSLNLPDKEAIYFQTNNSTDPYVNAKATLGRVLFYDTRLSVNNAVSCASCHRQEFAFADNVAFSRGFENRLTGRNSPAIQNIIGAVNSKQFHFGMLEMIREANFSLFWDGREQSVFDLVAGPISNHIEMGVEDPGTLASKLSGLSYYKELVGKAYPGEEVSFDKISESIALFICAIGSGNTRFDQYNEGVTDLTAEEKFGMQLFNTKYDCTSCHNLMPSPYGMFSDFSNIGLDVNPSDKGRGTISLQPMENGSFKIPNLRNVALTAPYMHDGRFKTLEDVIDHYSQGIKDVPNLAMELRDMKGKPIKMNIPETERKALVAFLGTLTDYTMITDSKFSNPFIVN